jgi:hypothetical protein
MRVWDGETEACLSTTYFEPVHGVDVANNLANGRVLSWTGTNLRLWDSQSGECFATLEGHAKDVLGVVVLTNERILSWAWKELRLWDSHYGKCLATMDGHTDYVDGALELIDGRVLSWSRDHTLRLWDSQTGACLVTLTGHNACVNGSLVLLDGRLLSWSNDKTMRLWTSQGDACLMVFQGHNTYIDGAQELADGRLCSWAGDEIRLWDTQTGVCLAAFEGVGPVLDLADGRLLSRRRNTFYLLDAQGACVSHIPTSDLVCRHPDWALAYARSTGPANVVGRCYLTSSDRIAVLRHAASTIGLSCWNAEEAANVHCLLPDGTAIATQISGQVCVLKLYLGQNRISLAEAESLLGLGMENGQ